MPKITLFISAALLANEILLEAQIFILAIIFSTKLLHSILVSLLAVMGAPKYLRGKLHSYRPVIYLHLFYSSCEHPVKASCDFYRLAFSPTHL